MTIPYENPDSVLLPLSLVQEWYEAQAGVRQKTASEVGMWAAVRRSSAADAALFAFLQTIVEQEDAVEPSAA